MIFLQCETILKGAEQSPRVENGVIYWYCGDTFLWTLKFIITECDGTEYILKDTDKIVVEFKKNLYSQDNIYVFEFQNQEYVDNSITMQFTQEISSLFPYGFYKMGVHLEDTDVTTLLPATTICVENVV